VGDRGALKGETPGPALDRGELKARSAKKVVGCTPLETTTGEKRGEKPGGRTWRGWKGNRISDRAVARKRELGTNLPPREVGRESAPDQNDRPPPGQRPPEKVTGQETREPKKTSSRLEERSKKEKRLK